MKNLVLTAVAIVGLAVSARAALQTYKTFSTGGLGTANPLTSVINIPEDPNSQIRIVDVSYTSDTNNGAIVFSTSSTALYQTATNVLSSSVTNQVSTTNGLSANCQVVLNHGGTLYTNTVLTWNSSTNTPVGPYGGTNIVLATGGWGVNASVADNIYVMGQASMTRYVGSGTNAIDGTALYVGNYGRPVTVSMTPGLVTNRLSVTVHYDSSSQ